MHRTPAITCCLLALTTFAPARTPGKEQSGADPALDPPVVLIKPGIRHSDGRRVFQGIPTIERTVNGRLWAAWIARTGKNQGPDSFVILVTSDDGGVSWSKPRLVIDPPGPVRAFDPCLWLDPDGLLWLFWAQSNGRWDGRGGVWRITCEDSQTQSPTWSAPRRVCDGVMLNKPTALSNDERLLPVSVWAQSAGPTTAPSHRHSITDQSAANVFKVPHTADETLALIGQARAPQREYDEHQIIEREDGSLWMLIRVPTGIAECESNDGGKTWSEPRHSPIKHINARFCIRRLQSGRLLLITHEPPDGKTRSHLIARLSDDEGKTWQGGLMLDARPGVSYPDAIEGPQGIIRVIYDFERSQSKQILMAHITEKNILSGKPARNTCLRVLVNQATGTTTEQDE